MSHWGMWAGALCVCFGGQIALGDPSPALTDGVGRSPEPPPPMVGDAVLRGEFAADSITKVGASYVARLMDGSKAELTLVPRIQQKADAVLRQAAAPVAGIVVMDLQGRILALAGRENGRKKPARALSVWAPAASVFKVVTSAALLSVGFDPAKKTCGSGGSRGISEGHLKDSPRDKICETLEWALARSTNVVFAKLANRFLEREDLQNMAAKFGLGKAPSFALEAAEGRVALPQGGVALARVAAGFHRVDMSPLQGALVASLVANEGRAVTPRIVERVVPKGGEPIEVLSPPRRPVLPEAVAKRLGNMMKRTVSDGTGFRGFHDKAGRAFLPGLRVAGKTGSLSRHKPYRKFSWFVGYAPADEPRYIVSVLLGNGEKWRMKATTAARMLLQAALK